MSDQIVIFHQGALGDFLLACPLIQGIAYGLGVSVYFVIPKKHLGLVENTPYFGGFLSHDSSVFLPFFDDLLWRDAHLPKEFLGARAMFLFGQSKMKDFADRINARLDETRCFWIRSFPVHENGMHVTTFLQHQFEMLGWHINIRPFDLFVGQNPTANKLLGHAPIVIHPGSGGFRKVWPLNNWWNVMAYIRSYYPNVALVVILGPADDVVRPFIMEAQRRLGFMIFDNPDLVSLVHLFKQSCCYLGNDSGVSHLAAASGIPICVIFGPTNPSVWAPLGHIVTVIRDLWDESAIQNSTLSYELRFSIHPDVQVFIEKWIGNNPA